MNRFVLGAALAVLALTGSLAAQAAPLPGPVVGAPAPEFALTTIDGKRVRLADYRGRTLVVNVWGSWCPPCRLETSDLNAEAAAQAAHGVAFLGVDTTEPVATVRAFVAAKAIVYPQAATDEAGEFVRAYGIRNFPTTLVIDPQGILRARHADNVLPRAQLHAYIVAAQAWKSAPLTSAFQTQLDALLAPASYPFAGDPAAVRSAAARAAAAIAQAENALDDAMDDTSRDHDLIKTHEEEETLRAAAIAALAPVAVSDADRALLARLRGDEASALGDWKAADAAYAQALRLAPGDLDALAADAYAVSQLGDPARAVAIDAQLAAKKPSYYAFAGLGRAQADAGDVAAAEVSFDRAQTLAAMPAQLAWTNLYYGRMEAKAQNPAKARAAFARALAAAQTIPSNDPRAAWYAEQAQEGMIALGILPGAATALSLAPWTGPDLPGSVASTIKYRLAVTGKPGANVALAAGGLPPHWIGSFCSDRVCAPFRTSVIVPAGGVKIVEFQVVPLGPAKVSTISVHVDASEHRKRVASAVAEVRV
ncbi:hypothetical protein WPS_09130 [Vulcanimicrobium alpinum]|uniref:Thioredoxin domain-containing protein n=1 Tax=Vulcanimicrobium alpinum TaxID=3016050 RepID=A0AAN2C9I0_UNVUL|nr:TlpA disulfide reductase family protein [Vulcanimicrobium alpinum]BDE05637.1 hypothetical protein WPS_09130 [Vulcanimicrobium alpinum]